MPLCWNDIRDRATRFARDWQDADGRDSEIVFSMRRS